MDPINPPFFLDVRRFSAEAATQCCQLQRQLGKVVGSIGEVPCNRHFRSTGQVNWFLSFGFNFVNLWDKKIQKKINIKKLRKKTKKKIAMLNTMSSPYFSLISPEIHMTRLRVNEESLELR
jgi:hypothetical protein